MTNSICLLIAWAFDRLLGDPASLPHPIVGFGKLIAAGEHAWNKGKHRFGKGAALALLLVAGIFLVTAGVQRMLESLSPLLLIAFNVLFIFYCLAGTTLIREVREVFRAVERSLEEGRTHRRTRHLGTLGAGTNATRTSVASPPDWMMPPTTCPHASPPC